MPNKNIVLWDGTVVTVPEEDAAKLEAAHTGRERTTTEALAGAATAAFNRDLTPGDKIRSALEGAADTATVGLYGKAVGAISDEERFSMQRSAQLAPGYRLAGELGAFAAPTGLLGGVVKGAGELTAVGAASRLGAGLAEATGSKVAGRLAEGAIFGVGGHVASTNVTGDPLTIEGLVAGAGVGGVLNVGAGFLGDRLTGLTDGAKKAVNEAEALADKAKLVETNAKHFEADSGVSTAYKQFTIAVKVRQAAQQAELRAWDRQVTKYTDFTKKQLGRSIEDAENVVRSVGQRYGEPTVAAAPEATPFDITDTAGPTTPPTDMAGKLKDYRERISRVYQMKGGRTKINPQQWSRASGPPDTEGAMRELRALYTDLQRDFPKAAGRLKPIPEALPPRPEVAAPVELASTFKGFVNQRPETIARVANGLSDDTAGEFKRVIDELGIAPGATPAETITAAHGSAREWLKAMEDVKAAEKAATSGTSFFTMARRFALNAIKFKIGYGIADYVGGALGTAAGIAGRSVAGSALNSVDNALVNGSMMAAKTSIKDNISSVVAKWGGPIEAGAKELGPVTAYLAGGHFGQPDTETDTRKLARKRTDEIHGIAMTAPDTAYSAVEGLLGHPSDAAFKIHQHVTGAVNYLKGTLALDPGLNIKMFTSNWTPSWHDSIALAHRLEAVHNPLSSLARIMSGAGHPAGADALWTVWPAIMNQAAQDVVEKAINGEYTYAQASNFSRLFRVPLTGFQNPAVSLALQAQYLPQPTAGGSSKPAQSTGRPPTVQSPVAGSSVASLIH